MVGKTLFHSLLTLERCGVRHHENKQDLMSEPFYQTNFFFFRGAKSAIVLDGAKSPLLGVYGKAYSFLVYHWISNLKGVVGA